MVEPLADRVLALTLADEPGQLAALLLDRPRWEGPLDVEAAFGGRTPEGAAPLHAAAVGGRSACLAALLAAGAPSARVEPSGHTALHLACQGGHVACAAQLLAAFPGDVNAATARGHTPLMVCLETTHGDAARAAATARLLLRRGADPLRRRPTEAAGVLANAALYECCLLGRDALCRALCEGYDVAAQVAYKTRGQGHNCFHAACDRGHARCLQAVLAACGASSDGTRAAARALISGADGDGACPIHLAAHSGAAACVRLLLDFDACLFRLRMNASHQTPLYLACARGHLETAEVLLGYDASGEAAEAPEFTPLHAAAASGAADVCALVLAARPELLRVEDPDHRTPLATAVSHGKLESARLLAIAGAAPRYGAVDLVDEAHARNLSALAAWLRDICVFRAADEPLPVLCFAPDLGATHVRALLRAGAAADVVAIRALGDAVADGADDAAPAPPPPPLAAATRPWQPATHELFPRAARVRAYVALVVLRRRLPGLLVVDRVLPFAVDRGSARVDEQAALLALVLGRRPFTLAERLRGVP